MKNNYSLTSDQNDETEPKKEKKPDSNGTGNPTVEIIKPGKKKEKNPKKMM